MSSEAIAGGSDGNVVRLGLIGGSGLLKSAMLASLANDESTVSTEFGEVKVRSGMLSPQIKVVVVQRHACDPACDYSPPHLVNYKAIMQCLKKLDVQAVVGVCSVGSMKVHISTGTIVIPDDFFCPWNVMSTFPDHRAHNIPGMNPALRGEMLTALFNGGLRPLDGGVYFNSSGPRFETKSEIRFMSQFGDIVGMTAAHEAELAKELDIPYAILAAVDNMANGIGEKITMDAFYKDQAKNKAKVEDAVHVVLSHFIAYPDILLRLQEAEQETAAEQLKTTAAYDTIIHAGHIVTVDEENRVLEKHALVIKDKKIIDLLPSTDADTKYGAFSSGSSEIIRLNDAVLMPGLVNAHTHASMVYMRGFGDDMALDTWLTTKIWPAEVRCVSSEFVRQGAQHACAEFIKGGTTCFSDMYFFPEAVAEVIDETGMRGVVGAVLIEFPSNYAGNAEEYLTKAEALLESITSKSSRVTASVAPHSPYAVSNEHLKAAHALAHKYNAVFHTHLHETEREVEDSKAGKRDSQFCHQCETACRPLEAFVDAGIVDKSMVAAHMCYLTDEEIETLAKTQANVVHCPTSNLKLASGFCPVAKLTKAGVNVALGTDGASSNNSLDMFAEMKLAAVLAKGVSKDPEALPAVAALRMATINGAKALGIGSKTGSLEVGKEADVVAVSMADLSSMPTYNVVSQLVYATGRHQVTDVWCAGSRLLRAGELVTIDAGQMRRTADKWKAVLEEIDNAHDGSYKE
mmetsp:Transcript_20142/g.37437  ORF Transcript_20142/g.37437 Transcript_20142/m.37437 type:complete len:744 (+) Transcript_20142:88-2319(+)|eukprot:CAMPEP_0184547186 /NCGR_PEP_ID=MMETSP0199_2-20130426/5408_1 /TAXON_ID=1112570 /ORGANISM="Thraustochytrium sp., Strain LLF1b" /LENGTH=743 /DNA_ID=CAMNT_0026941649 /DNA_START=45 /DNA_END=2276 /DNA_ORIENTATION=+